MIVGFDLQRFLDAQASVYDNVLNELRGGRKRTHWMWFMFPQVAGLGESETSRYYSIRSLQHATEYAQHPVLGRRLLECTSLVNKLEGRSAADIFGQTDTMKFGSSMTLFDVTFPESCEFRKALDLFFDGAPDDATLRIVNRWRQADGAGTTL